mmetsp:Transcript_24487/g.33562  ORF Transcript_24487/g.33562 Transcript_24487/m.33562 type:complete len:102 (+) Transcript_24487:88-393(+)
MNHQNSEQKTISAALPAMQKDLKDVLKLLPDVTDIVLLCDWIMKSSTTAAVDANYWLETIWKDYNNNLINVPEEWLSFRKKHTQKNFHFIREVFASNCVPT